MQVLTYALTVLLKHLYTNMKKFFMFCQQEVNFYFGTVVCVAKTFL